MKWVNVAWGLNYRYVYLRGFIQFIIIADHYPICNQYVLGCSYFLNSTYYIAMDEGQSNKDDSDDDDDDDDDDDE